MKTLIISYADFTANCSVDVKPFVKKLQSLDYIPWAVAHDLLLRYNDKLEVGFEETTDKETGENVPFFLTSRGAYLKPYLYDKETGLRTASLFFPIRNASRKTDANVDMSTIGNQMQRAYSKCIAQHTGLGWSLYSRFDESLLELEEAEQAFIPVKAQTPFPANPKVGTRRVVAPVEEEDPLF